MALLVGDSNPQQVRDRERRDRAKSRLSSAMGQLSKARGSCKAEVKKKMTAVTVDYSLQQMTQADPVVQAEHHKAEHGWTKGAVGGGSYSPVHTCPMGRAIRGRGPCLGGALRRRGSQAHEELDGGEEGARWTVGKTSPGGVRGCSEVWMLRKAGAQWDVWEGLRELGRDGISSAQGAVDSWER